MKNLALIVTALAGICSCNAISGILHDGEVIATVGEHKLYSHELAGVAAAMKSPEDSAKLVQAYIDSWTLDMLFVDLAESQLTESEKDVSKELESYKRALLRYRYEQKYLNQRLDTAVTQTQIEDYYASHKESFILKEPILKAVFAVIPEKSPHLSDLKKHMSEDPGDDIVVRDSLAYAYAITYNDFGNRWVDASTVASALGMDVSKMASSVRKGFVTAKDDKDNLLIAYISDQIGRGEEAPVAYCSEKIKEYILSSRKKDLLSGLERDLMRESPGNNSK